MFKNIKEWIGKKLCENGYHKFKILREYNRTFERFTILGELMLNADFKEVKCERCGYYKVIEENTDYARRY